MKDIKLDCGNVEAANNQINEFLIYIKSYTGNASYYNLALRWPLD
jgi:hypothetical protein